MKGLQGKLPYFIGGEIPIGLIVVSALVARAYRWYSPDPTAPPSQVTSISEFIEWQHETDWYQFEHNGSEFVAVRTVALQWASGPPEYIFDRSGELVDWSRDLADDTKYSRKWRNRSDWRRMSSAEMRAFVAKSVETR